jgi:hypothetical protein
MSGSRNNSIPELQDVAKKHTVEALEAKLDKCYSSEKYKDFREEVESISLKQLGTDTAHAALTPHIDSRVERLIAERFWKNKTFWIPTVIASAAVVVSYFKP